MVLDASEGDGVWTGNDDSSDRGMGLWEGSCVCCGIVTRVWGPVSSSAAALELTEGSDDSFPDVSEPIGAVLSDAAPVPSLGPAVTRGGGPAPASWSEATPGPTEGSNDSLLGVSEPIGAAPSLGPAAVEEFSRDSVAVSASIEVFSHVGSPLGKLPVAGVLVGARRSLDPVFGPLVLEDDPGSNSVACSREDEAFIDNNEGATVCRSMTELGPKVGNTSLTESTSGCETGAEVEDKPAGDDGIIGSISIAGANEVFTGSRNVSYIMTILST